MRSKGIRKTDEEQDEHIKEDSPAEFPVYLKVYDMSYGLVKRISKPILGYHLGGAWHTGLAVYGKEYIYGDGICSFTEERCEEITDAQLIERILLGTTRIQQKEFEEYLDNIADTFSECKYDFFDWNCHNFTDTAARYLTGKGIPEEYLLIATCMRRSTLGRITIVVIRVGRWVSIKFNKMSSALVMAWRPQPMLRGTPDSSDLSP